MITAKVDTAVLHSGDIHLGVRLVDDDGRAFRFIRVVVPAKLLDYQFRAELLEQFEDLDCREPEGLTLF